MAYVTAPGVIEFREVPLPEPGNGEVLLEVKAVTLCGSDKHIFKGKHPAVSLPIPVGHEIAGQVVRVGEGVRRLAPGDRVAVEPVLTCGVCHFCRRGEYHLCENISFQYRVGQGGLTSHFLVAERWAHRLPDHLTYAEGALLEPLSVTLHALRRADLHPGDTCAIFGDGPIGLLLLQLALLAGCGAAYVAGRNHFRLELAQQLGARAAFHNDEIDSLAEILARTDGLGVDRAFEAAGVQQTLIQSLRSLRKGGHAVVVGLFEEAELPVPINLFIQKEIALSGSQGYHWDFQRALTLLEAHRLDLKWMLTHHFPLSQAQHAFDLLMDPEDQAMKVVLEP
jgi:2-desacetyl-2-hydroxyethyl bacteriochlorophyllide A dehydrogenase